MVLVRDILSCPDDYLCQIILKSHYIPLSYGSNMILEHTNTYTHRPGELYMPFCHFMAGAYIQISCISGVNNGYLDFAGVRPTGLMANLHLICNTQVSKTKNSVISILS